MTGAPSTSQPVVRVCTLQLDQCRHRIDAFARALPDEEQQRARRFVRWEDQARHILARTLTRRVAATHLGMEPRSVTFLQQPAGKPSLAQPGVPPAQRLEFNVSHSGNCVLLAWTVGSPVGVDVEAMMPARQTPFTQLASTVFSSTECQALSSTFPHLLGDTFYRIWVRKEAVLKAEGCGLGGDTQSFTVARPADHGIVWPDIISLAPGAPSWKLHDLQSPPGHAACVATVPGAVIEDTTHALSLEIAMSAS